jgi:hypothetical protein
MNYSYVVALNKLNADFHSARVNMVKNGSSKDDIRAFYASHNFRVKLLKREFGDDLMKLSEGAKILIKQGKL